MNEVQRENVMFALVIVSIVSLVISMALGTIAIVAIRELQRVERQLAKKEPSKELVPWDERPQRTFGYITEEMVKPQPVRRSILLNTERRLSNDRWA